MTDLTSSGRAPVPLLTTIESLSEYGATLAEIAAHVGQSLAALKCVEGCEAARLRGEAKRALLLKKAGMESAMRGNVKAIERLSPEGALSVESKRRLASYVLKTRPPKNEKRRES